MEDILEEIVGDIQDESMKGKSYSLQRARFIVDPHIDIYDLNEELGINLETEDVDYNTLWANLSQYGDVPQRVLNLSTVISKLLYLKWITRE